MSLSAGTRETTEAASVLSSQKSMPEGSQGEKEPANDIYSTLDRRPSRMPGGSAFIRIGYPQQQPIVERPSGEL
jgi:hypothetical protein